MSGNSKICSKCEIASRSPRLRCGLGGRAQHAAPAAGAASAAVNPKTMRCELLLTPKTRAEKLTEAQKLHSRFCTALTQLKHGQHCTDVSELRQLYGIVPSLGISALYSHAAAGEIPHIYNFSTIYLE